MIKTMTIFTFGYGNRTNYTRLIKCFNEHKIKYLIDVRLKPYGWSAIWHCNQLEKMCEQNGVKYISKKQLGNTSGKPKWVPENKNSAIKAMKDVAKLHDDGNLILMCSELDYNRCHRKEVATRLSVVIGENITIEHLI